jgi:pectinesterase
MTQRKWAACAAWLTMLMLALSAAACTATNLAMPGTRFTVQSDCSGVDSCFPRIQAALDAAVQEPPTAWVVVDVAPGNYYEKVTVRRGLTRLRGSGPGKTHLHFDAIAQTAGQYHRRNWGTPGSATLTIDADQVTVERMTVENTFDYLSNDALPDSDTHKIPNSQAVALLLDINSDRVYLRDVTLLGYQDTLFTNGKRALIRHSTIAGNVDFIFGDGQLLIEDSIIKTRRRAAAVAPGEFESFVTAPSTPLTQPVGIVIYRSRLTREPGVRDGSVALGRPWHPTTNFADGRYADPNAVGQAVFIDCYMDAHISRDGWTSMLGTARSGAKTDVFRPQDSRFAESGSHGPGAHRADIGIRWQDAPGIEAIRKMMFEGWPDPGR